jgi:5'-nucleotidase
LVGYHKPDRRIYEHALEKLGASAEETLFVGDTWTADVAGPIDAGIPAVWLNPRKLPPDSDHVPLATIEKLEHLLDIL